LLLIILPGNYYLFYQKTLIISKTINALQYILFIYNCKSLYYNKTTFLKKIFKKNIHFEFLIAKPNIFRSTSPIAYIVTVATSINFVSVTAALEASSSSKRACISLDPCQPRKYLELQSLVPILVGEHSNARSLRHALH